MATDRELLIQSGETEIAAGTPVARTGRLVTADAVNYGTVVTYTVPAGKQGDLHEVSMFTSNFPKTHFRLTIAGAVQFTDLVIGTTLSLPWRTNRLPVAAVILLEAKSTDGTSVTVDGSITAAER